MTKIKLYFPKIILTFLMIFLLIGTELSILIQHKALTSQTFESIVSQQALDEKSYSALESYFKSRANSTGIPADVYLNAISQEEIRQGILSSISEAVEHMHSHIGDGFVISMDFTELETSVTEFFNQYADENNYQKDEIFNQKVQANIQEAEEKILYTVDTFKFRTIYEHGWFDTIRKFLDIFRTVMTVLCICTAVILILLILCCKGDFSELLYWLGLSELISSLLVSVPCLYLVKSNYFSGFVVKDIQIYAAVTGYLNYITNRISVAFMITGITGIIFLIIFAVMQKSKKQTS